MKGQQDLPTVYTTDNGNRVDGRASCEGRWGRAGSFFPCILKQAIVPHGGMAVKRWHIGCLLDDAEGFRYCSEQSLMMRIIRGTIFSQPI